MKKNNGFSTIELILYIGLTGMLLGVMSQVFLAIVGVRSSSTQTTAVQQDSRFLLARLAYAVRRADDIVSPQIGEASSSMTLRTSESGNTITERYYWDGQNIWVTNASQSSQLNSNRTVVTSFSLSRNGTSLTEPTGTDTITVSLSLEGNAEVTTGQQSISVQTTVGQR